MTQLHISSAIGKIGEDIAVRYLVSQGFSIIIRNFLTKYGEIDIIATKGDVVHYIEVKSVYSSNLHTIDALTHRPEDNVSTRKLRRMYRTIEIYQSKMKNSVGKWQIDILSVFVQSETKEAKVRALWNVIEC
jgi:putative endonuclease